MRGPQHDPSCLPLKSRSASLPPCTPGFLHGGFLEAPEQAYPSTARPSSVIIHSVPGDGGRGVSVTALTGPGAPRRRFCTCVLRVTFSGLGGADVGYVSLLKRGSMARILRVLFPVVGLAYKWAWHLVGLYYYMFVNECMT